MKQKGIAPLIILIIVAAIIAVGFLAYSYFNKPVSPAQKQNPAPTTGVNPLEVTSQTDPRNCSDVDYTGCDTSADFMTWHDDGERNPSSTSPDPKDYK